MKNFAAIDFETANGQRSSVCSVGIVIVRNGEIKEKFYSLIKPEPNYYSRICRSVHGLRHEDTDNAEVFPLVWKKIASKIKGLPLVAHNAPFDRACLEAVMEMYRMDWETWGSRRFYCTLKASRLNLRNLENHQLHTVAEACGYHLENHHYALADAEACAAIAMKLKLDSKCMIQPRREIKK